MFIDGVKLAGMTMRFVILFLLCAVLVVQIGGLCFFVYGVPRGAASVFLFQVQVAPIVAGMLASADTVWQIRRLRAAWRARMVRPV